VEDVQAGFDVFDDFLGEVFGVREVVEVGEPAVFEPEEVEAGFVASDDFGVGEFAPAAVGVFVSVLGFFAYVAVGRVVAGDEVGEVFKAQGFAFEGVMDVGAVVVVPDFFGPRGFGSRLVCEGTCS